jgi:hypothetical protein
VEDVDEHVIEQRLRQQQQESARDAKWLQQEEKVRVSHGHAYPSVSHVEGSNSSTSDA